MARAAYISISVEADYVTKPYNHKHHVTLMSYKIPAPGLSIEIIGIANRMLYNIFSYN